MLLCERQERFSGFFRCQGQIDVFSREGPLVGAAEQEQCFRKVDCSGVDVVESIDEFAGVAVRIVAGHVEKCLRDRQRGAQFVGSVGCEHFMDECSHHGARGVSGIEAQNRGTLCSIMEHSGFEPYDHEWWHYALRDEPYPDTYFDFPIL